MSKTTMEFCGGPWDGIMREVTGTGVPAARVILSPAVVGVAWTYVQAREDSDTIQPFVLTTADQARWDAIPVEERARIQAVSHASVRSAPATA